MLSSAGTHTGARMSARQGLIGGMVGSNAVGELVGGNVVGGSVVGGLVGGKVIGGTVVGGLVDDAAAGEVSQRQRGR